MPSSLSVEMFEAATKRVLALDEDALHDVWCSLVQPAEGTPEAALSKLAWLELQLRKWIESDGARRREMEQYDALGAVWSFWKPILAMGGGEDYRDHHVAREFGAYAPVIARLMRERATKAGWLPPPVERTGLN